MHLLSCGKFVEQIPALLNWKCPRTLLEGSSVSGRCTGGCLLSSMLHRRATGNVVNDIFGRVCWS